MHWELEMLEKALDAGDVQLAKRYLGKLKAQLFCVKCKHPIFWAPADAEPYYKGFVHRKCRQLDKQRS